MMIHRFGCPASRGFRDAGLGCGALLFFTRSRVPHP